MPKYEELKAFRKQNLIPAYNDSSSEKTMLHREARALAISRLEESARTEEEFANWAFTFTTSFLYYMDYDSLDEQTKKPVSSGYVCIWRNIPDLPYLISGKCPGHRMELPFPARHDPDVLFFYAYGF